MRLTSPASADDGSGVGQVIAASSTDHVKHGPGHVAVVARWSGGALRQDLGASLTVDGAQVLTDENAGKLATTSALAGGVVELFMFDDNANGRTDLGLITSGPFLSFTDVFMDASKPRFIELGFKAGSEDTRAVFNLKVPSWPSEDENGRPVTLQVVFQ